MASWSLIPASPLSVSSTQSTTDAAPSGDDGLGIAGVGGFDLFIECDEGQTFVGPNPGSLTGYRKGSVAEWAHSADLDLTIPAEAAGQRRWAFTGWTVGNPRGRIAHIANAVSVTGGAVKLIYEVTTLRGHRA